MLRVSSSGRAETLNLDVNATAQTCFIHSKSNRKCFQVHVPLPLPKHLVIFGLGEWKSSDVDATISADVVVSAELPAQRIGTLSTQARYVEDLLKKKKKKKTAKSPLRMRNKPRCLIWEGDWRRDVITVAAEKGRRGVYGKIVLTVCGEVGLIWSVCSKRLLTSYCVFLLTPGNSWCLQHHSSGWKEMFVPRFAQLHWSILHTKSDQHEWNGEIK